ncbi:MAG: cysteine desulfurase family protein [Acutalibacteraceae bacterium]|nr:cysteine desulfurase family protein [Acutalibacteraceae bacterium]
MDNIIYLDNSSTTMPCDKAIEYMTTCLKENWGNPSSLHLLGMNAENTVTSARECVAKSISANPNEIIFTSGGTEANNTAVMSALFRKNRGNRVITTAIEHHSVLECFKKLENCGFEVIYLKPNRDGVISLEELENSLNSNTVLVSMMMVNNEVGSVEPIEQAVKLTKAKAPNAFFHCDAVQGYGKLPINVKKLGVDMLTASGHKVHAPKGIGFLYLNSKTHIPPFIVGGGQEKGMRSGTESVPLIASLQGAVEDFPNLETALKTTRSLFLYAKKRLGELPQVTFNSGDNGLPYVLNISVNGYRSETLLHFLEMKDIYVSSGSACSKGNTSYVLKEMGVNPKSIDSALRLSFSKHTTEKEIDVLYHALKEATEKLRKA